MSNIRSITILASEDADFLHAILQGYLISSYEIESDDGTIHNKALIIPPLQKKLYIKGISYTGFELQVLDIVLDWFLGMNLVYRMPLADRAPTLEKARRLLVAVQTSLEDNRPRAR